MLGVGWGDFSSFGFSRLVKSGGKKPNVLNVRLDFLNETQQGPQGDLRKDNSGKAKVRSWL